MPPDSVRDNLVPWPNPPDDDSGEQAADTAPVRPSWWRNAARAPDAGEDPPLSDTLERFLFGDNEALLDLDPAVAAAAWSELAGLRTAINESADRGGPLAELFGLHVRLDEASGALRDLAVKGAVADQRRLLEDISHDIRSPLNSILFLADALCNQRQGDLNPVQERQVGVLYTAAVSLVKLVNDLIDYARMQNAGTVTVSLVSFSIESVLHEVTGLVGPLVSHSGVEFHTSVNTEGMRSGDPRLLSRILLNLVTNAIQATGEGGKVTVQVFERETRALCVEVLDDGLGTDVELLRRRITKPDEEPGHSPGWTHGLGLSITARLVAAAGGSIEVRSQPGEGTVFSVELPFSRL